MLVSRARRSSQNPLLVQDERSAPSPPAPMTGIFPASCKRVSCAPARLHKFIVFVWLPACVRVCVCTCVCVVCAMGAQGCQTCKLANAEQTCKLANAEQTAGAGIWRGPNAAGLGGERALLHESCQKKAFVSRKAFALHLLKVRSTSRAPFPD